MAVSVYVPQRQQADSTEDKLLSLGSMIAPMFGPAGMAVGAGLGAAKMLNEKPQQAVSAQLASDNSAMSRRMQELDNSPQEQIRKGIEAATQAGRPDLAKPLLAADYLAKNKQQV